MPEAPILEVSGVTTFYGTIQALHGVDLVQLRKNSAQFG